MADVMVLDNEGAVGTAVSAKVADAFREAFVIAEGDAVEGLKYREDPRWDSVGHMVLIAALETRFDAILEVEEILAMSDYSKAVEIMTLHVKD